jgi:hypothetical protein
MEKRKQYTVIGLYSDNMQRYAETVWATSPFEAEYKAGERVREQDDSLSLIVAGVLEGQHEVIA